MKKRIYYHDTDCGGVVYYANYLKYLEEARTEYFASKGIPIGQLTKEGVLFVVARQEIDYKAPAAYGDMLEVNTWISEVSNVRLNFDAEIKHEDGKVIARARTILVCVDRNLKPQALPETIKKKIEVIK